MSMGAKQGEAAARVGVDSSPAPRFLPRQTISVRLLAPPYTDGRLVFGIVSNMSSTGACIITNRSLPVDIDVQLEIRSGKKDVSMVSARIVWCAERLEPVKEIVGYLTGVCFETDAEAVHELLSSGIFQSVP